MQNTHVDDLVNGDGVKEGFQKTIYLRKDDQGRIDEVVALGYVLIQKGDDTQDMSLYGLPEVAEVKEEVKEV